MGNDAHISPDASIQDGLLDVCVIKPFPLWRFVEMGFRMVTKTTPKTKYLEIIRGKNILVKRSAPGPVHLDGEPRIMGTETQITVFPGAIKVVVGSSFKSR